MTYPFTQYETVTIRPYAVTKNVGDTIYLTATGSGGIAPYTATFTKSTNATGTITITGALTATYLVPSGDAGQTLTFYSTVTDSCSTPKTSAQVQDTATINAICNVPNCSFALS